MAIDFDWLFNMAPPGFDLILNAFPVIGRVC